MPRTSKIISIPKPAPGSFNKQRPAGTLLQAQVVHLQKALIKHHADVERLLAIDLKEIRTEAEVADYARRITALLHPHHAKQPAR
ncbi:MAG TPA: hypothetical protein VN777_13835 [Terriglobales bacterium]|jgi:hypothetical protein|nr:hypothetical protein [Terriglobales bacterium]